jgi:hypothetical protein
MREEILDILKKQIDNNNMNETEWSEIIGNFLGEFFSAIIILGLTGGILFFCWNYGLHQVAPVDKIKYFECWLLILGYRALVFKKK